MLKNLISSLTILSLSFILTGCNGSSSSPSPKDTTAPVLSSDPAGGTYNNAQNVTLSADESATIYYTIDGSMPDESSTSYAEPISITENTTLKAIAIDAAGNKSEELNEEYIIDTTAPVLSANPAGGTYNNAQSVTLSADESATIYYTLDGSMPDESSTSYADPISITENTTLKAIAIDAAGNKSEELNEEYIVDTTAPVLSADPAGGTYNNVQSVTLSADESATIYYTLDGSMPDESSTSYVEPISITENITLKAIAIDAAGNKSEELNEEYIIEDTTAPILSADPAGGTYNNAQSVTLSADESATIYYTLDGSMPDESSTNYVEPISITENTTLKAIAIDVAGNKSEELNEVYDFDTTAPVVTATINQTTGKIILTVDEPASIYYTLDGTDPSTESMIYTAPFSLSQETTVKYYAQDTAGNNSGIVSKTYTIGFILEQNYTSSNNILETQSILLDSAGNLWFASNGKGVSKYDTSGVWTTYTTQDGLTNNYVNTIFEDSQNNLWFGTGGGGISKYNTSDNTWTTYTTQDGLTNNAVQTILEDSQNNLWFGTNDGISKYNTSDNTWTSYTQENTNNDLVNNNVRTIFKDRANNLWFGTYGGVSKYNTSDNTWTAYTKETTNNGLFHNIVFSITQDEEGNMYFGTWGGVSQYNVNENTWNELLSNSVNSVFVDSNNNLWVMTVNGISHYNIDNDTWTPYTTSDGLSSNNTKTVAEDADGNIWVGNGGIFVDKFDGTSWSTHSTAPANELQSVQIRSSIKDSDGNLWFGTQGGGVSKYDTSSGVWTTYTTADGLVDNNVNTIIEDSQNNLWFGTFSYGVSKYNTSNNTWTTYNKETTNYGLWSNFVRTIIEDSQNNLWFGTLTGVSKYDGSSWMTYTTVGLVNNDVQTILEDSQNNLWFGTFGGVSKYDGSSWTTYTKENTNNGLVSNDFRSIIEDSQNNLWFGTRGGGVSKYDTSGVWTAYTQENSDLLSNDVYSILEDSQNNLWFGTSGGVSKYDTNGVWTSYTTQDGLVDNDVRTILEDSQNNLWFGTDGGGISKFRYLLPVEEN